MTKSCLTIVSCFYLIASKGNLIIPISYQSLQGWSINLISVRIYVDYLINKKKVHCKIEVLGGIKGLACLVGCLGVVQLGGLFPVI